MKDLHIIKDDIVKMKQTAVINNSDSNVESLASENEILRAKIVEHESQINSLSRSDDEGRIRDRIQYEKKINEMNEENQKSIEQYRQILNKIQGLEEQLKEAKSGIITKDSQIADLET